MKGDLNMIISTDRDEDDTEAGWSEEIDGLHVCPACRERMVADP